MNLTRYTYTDLHIEHTHTQQDGTTPNSIWLSLTDHFFGKSNSKLLSNDMSQCDAGFAARKRPLQRLVQLRLASLIALRRKHR